MPLTDREAVERIQRMITFIEVEAFEKVRQILLESDQEYAEEKSHLIEQGQQTVDAFYEKKTKIMLLDESQQLLKTRNQAKIDLLNNRYELINSIIEEAYERIKSIPNSNKEKYSNEILHNLTLQSLYILLEGNVKLRCLENDRELFKGKILKGVLTEYEENVGKNVKVQISDSYLHENSGGGVEISTPNGKILVDNTLGTRLRVITPRLIGSLKADIFGRRGFITI